MVPCVPQTRTEGQHPFRRCQCAQVKGFGPAIPEVEQRQLGARPYMVITPMVNVLA